MAYDKHTWTCDEPITVERLNHIEDGIANAGGGDCGFECEEDVTLLTNETVTTTEQNGYNDAQLSYSQFIDAETIRVTFDGVEYDCPRIALSSSQNFYGGFNLTTETPDFSQYPFAISSYSGSESIGGRGNTRDVDPPQNYIISQIAGTHTVKIEIVEETITTTPCFDLARGYSCEEREVGFINQRVTTESSQFHSFAEAEIPYAFLADPPQIAHIMLGNHYYECERQKSGSGWKYGASDDTFTEYPFMIEVYDVYILFLTPTAGTYSFSMGGMATVSTPTDCFKAAVQACPTAHVRVADGPEIKRKDIYCTNEQAVTVPAKTITMVTCSASESISGASYACWGSIHLPTSVTGSVIASPNEITNSGVVLQVYNPGDTAITINAKGIGIHIIDFVGETGLSVCAVLGQCGDGIR